jgi:hypothetical protein
VEEIKSFVLAGINITMNQYNKRKPVAPQNNKEEQNG